MRHSQLAPAAARLLPELLPFVAAFEQHHPPHTVAPLRTFLHACSRMIGPDEAGYAQSSLLTAGGYPVEFSFRSDTTHVHVTTETGPARELPQQRLSRAQRYTGAFSFAEHPLLKPFSAAAAQRYGTWLSYRYKAGQPGYKLYQEVSPATASLFWPELAALVASNRLSELLQPMLVAFVPGTASSTEFYLRIRQASLAGLHQLFALGGISTELSSTLDCLGWLGGLSREQLLRQRLGISFQAVPGQAPGLTLFVHTHQLCLANRSASTRILSLAQQMGYSLPVYQALVQRLEQHNPEFPVHGIISLKPMVGDKLLFSVGVRPW